LDLPPPPEPKANYGMHHRVGTLVHVSGHLPLTNDGVLKVGRVGEDGVGMEEGYEAGEIGRGAKDRRREQRTAGTKDGWNKGRLERRTDGAKR